MLEIRSTSDVDSLFRLPLESLGPLFQSTSLPKNVLTKERILDPSQGAAVEFFRSKKSGGGMRSISDTIQELNLSKHDAAILTAFGALPSYDPFSLRKALREALFRLNQEFAKDGTALTLPENLPLFALTPDMELQLAEYTKMFTRPLVRLIMTGRTEGANQGVETPADLIALVQRAQKQGDKEALGKLRRNMALVGRMMGASDMKQIEIEISAYGDAMLSLGYLKHYYFDVFSIPFQTFSSVLVELEKNKKLNAEVHGLAQTLKSLTRHLKDSMGAVEAVLTTLNQRVTDIWQHTTDDQFLAVRTLIVESHEQIAGLLCGWGARVGSWRNQTETHRLMSPSAQADFIIHYINPGVDKLPSANALRLLINK